MGYYRVGFDIVGVDHKPQPRYPFPFILGDALDVLARMVQGEKFLASDGRWYSIDDFVTIHASPPCQRYSRLGSAHANQDSHPDLVSATRNVLLSTGRQYVIENVEGAPLLSPILLCGSMFGLRVRRHRLFEVVPLFVLRPSCEHRRQGIVYGVYGHTGAGSNSNRFHKYGMTNSKADWQQAMGIDWMIVSELSQAIPPSYTEYIGRYLLANK